MGPRGKGVIHQKMSRKTTKKEDYKSRERRCYPAASQRGKKNGSVTVETEETL